MNATNARWGSLYDALYGSNVIPQTRGRAILSNYNPVRGKAVVARCNDFLDRHFPLRGAKYADITRFFLTNPTGAAAPNGGGTFLSPTGGAGPAVGGGLSPDSTAVASPPPSALALQLSNGQVTRLSEPSQFTRFCPGRQ